MKILILFLFVGSIGAAEFIGRDGSFYVFDDDGMIRSCGQPTRGLISERLVTQCWTENISTECKVLKKEDGYIDCKENN